MLLLYQDMGLCTDVNILVAQVDHVHSFLSIILVSKSSVIDYA